MICYNDSWASRMLKQSLFSPAQPQRAKTRPSAGKAAGESKPEAYPWGYVEDFDESRTKLADCFSILPGHELLQQSIPLIPFTMPAVGVDVPCLADIDDGAPPSHRTMFGIGQ